jgi:uncharacterized protein (TIGR02757 family)
MKKRVSTKTISDLQALLEREVITRNTQKELTFDKPDPLLIASMEPNEYKALICALYAYGNAHAIISFLQSLDFSLLDMPEKTIREKLSSSYYRFQTPLDTQELFVTLSSLKKVTSLHTLFQQGYQQRRDVMDGLKTLIEALYDVNAYRSKGYQFLLGKIPRRPYASPYKRWHMYLRWMVRKDYLDLGLWTDVERSDLLMPLDVHTFKMGQKLGLISQKSYGFKAVLELTEKLKVFDVSDPVKYDFALYRLGQERKVLE